MEIDSKYLTAEEALKISEENSGVAGGVELSLILAEVFDAAHNGFTHISRSPAPEEWVSNKLNELGYGVLIIHTKVMGSCVFVDWRRHATTEGNHDQPNAN